MGKLHVLSRNTAISDRINEQRRNTLLVIFVWNLIFRLKGVATVLKGERLILRAWEKDDLLRLHEFNNDLEVELLGGGYAPRPQSREQVQNWFEERAKSDKPRPEELGNFVIEADGKVIGTCGLWHFDATASTCALGIAIGDREYWGRHYGREAIGLLLDYAFRIHNLRRVWLDTSSANERALKCYRACGFVEEGRLRQQDWNNGQYVDRVYMGLLRDEYAGQAQAPKA